MTTVMCCTNVMYTDPLSVYIDSGGLLVLWLFYVFLCIFFILENIIVSTSAIDCMERLISRLSCCVERDIDYYSLTLVNFGDVLSF